MLMRRIVTGDTDGRFRFFARNGRVVGVLALLAAISVCLTDAACARDKKEKKRDRGAAAAAPPAAAAAATPGAVPTALTKAMAIDAVLQALAMNRSPAAEKTLEQIVKGEVAFGNHGQQAAQTAMLLLVMRPTPASDAFLLTIFKDPDESVRPGDQGMYPAAALRIDTAHALAKVGSPNIRLELAKLYTQSSTPPAVRSAIDEVIRAPSTANFAAQVEIFHSADVPDTVKDKLQQSLIEKNTAAVKVALRLEPDAASQAGAGNAGFPFSPAGGKPGAAGNPAAMFANASKMFGAAGGAPAMPAGGAPGSATVAALKPGSTAGSPMMMALDILGQMQNAQPIDPSLVAKELWKPDFVESIAQKLTEEKADSTVLVGALASIPTKPAREKLKEVLHKVRHKGPQDFGKMEAAETPAAAATTPAPANTSRGRGRRNKRDDDSFGNADQVERSKGRMGGGGIGMQNAAQAQQPKQKIVDFGLDWLDPGSLVVLKSVVLYEERPKEKPHHPMYSQRAPMRMTAAMEKRLHEKAEKQKALESKYEWRDAIEKAVRQWDDRLSAVAEASGDAQGGDDSATETGSKQKGKEKQEKSAAGKATKSGSVFSSPTAKKSVAKATATKGDTESAGQGKTDAAAVPTPSVALPFALHAGGKITKEYHLRWPEDLTGNLSSTVTDPLAVHYVRLEGLGEFGKALTHYRSAITAVPSGKTRTTLREIDDGKWLDTVQKDPTGHRTRSVDVTVTRQPVEDDDGKKSKFDKLTVEVLFVEIETPGADAATPGSTKKEPRETTSITPP